MDPLRLKVLEIVGIHKGANNRTCGIHSECGKSLAVGSQLKLHWALVVVSETVKELRDILPEEVPEVPGVPKKRGRRKKLPKELVETVKIKKERTVKARIWKDGVASCLVGYVSSIHHQ